jgi:hypothetical protein
MSARPLRICILLAIFEGGFIQGLAQEWTGTIPPSTHCLLRAYDQTSANYEAWMSGYKASPPRLNDREPIELAITVIEDDDLKSDNQAMPCGMRRTSMFVSAKGTVSWQRITSGAVQGGGPSDLAAEDLKVMRSRIATCTSACPMITLNCPLPDADWFSRSGNRMEQSQLVSMIEPTCLKAFWRFSV